MILVTTGNNINNRELSKEKKKGKKKNCENCVDLSIHKYLVNFSRMSIVFVIRFGECCDD